MPVVKNIWLVVLGVVVALGIGWWAYQSGRFAPAADGDQLPYVASSRTALATKLKIPRSEISVVSITAKEWSDSSLGCPEEGKVYTQVITPGYIVILEHKGEWYTYYTDRAGAAVTC